MSIEDTTWIAEYSEDEDGTLRALILASEGDIEGDGEGSGGVTLTYPVMECVFIEGMDEDEAKQITGFVAALPLLVSSVRELVAKAQPISSGGFSLPSDALETLKLALAVADDGWASIATDNTDGEE